MKKIEMVIECPACEGSGVYNGIGEGDGLAVICYKCNGSGAYKYHYSYNEFTGRKIKEGILRVYKQGYGYKLGLGTINFDMVGEVDMTSEGVSYQEFLDGKEPEHIKKLACPMLADQGACHSIKGFIDECGRLHGSMLLGIRLTQCNYYPRKAKCWKRFKKLKGEE